MKIQINAASWADTVAWMVDKEGNAVPIDNHVQKGEDKVQQLDEGGIACALRYAKLIGDNDYYEAAAVLAQVEVFGETDFDDLDEVVDLEETVDWLIDPANKSVYLEALQVPSFEMTARELVDLYKARNLDSRVDQARNQLHTLFERRMMRVRVGGIINTTTHGSTDIYFRIPDSVANGWYTGIGNFLYDHPQYAGFELHIYEEADNAGSRKELESYTDGKEFLDLHASRVSIRKQQRLDSAYKRADLYKQQFRLFLHRK